MPRQIQVGKHGQYLCEICDTDEELPGKGVVTFPSGDQFVVCPFHSYAAMKGGGVVRSIDG